MDKNTIAVVEDLFFAAKIKATAEAVGASVRFAKTFEAALTQARAQRPDAVLVDLHAARCEPFRLAQAFKESEELRNIPLIGFFSHVQTEIMRKAQAAGYDKVLPRSAFVKKLPDLLRVASIPSAGCAGQYPER